MTATLVPTRVIALDLFRKYNKSESLLRHALLVEGVMRYMAGKPGEDEEKRGQKEGAFGTPSLID